MTPVLLILFGGCVLGFAMFLKDMNGGTSIKKIKAKREREEA